MVCPEMGKTPEHVAVALMRISAQTDLSSQLEKIQVTTLVLAGEKSPIAGSDQIQMMNENLPQAQFEIFEGYGHGVHLLLLDRCLSGVLNFWKSIMEGYNI